MVHTIELFLNMLFNRLILLWIIVLNFGFLTRIIKKKSDQWGQSKLIKFSECFMTQGTVGQCQLACVNESYKYQQIRDRD